MLPECKLEASHYMHASAAQEWGPRQRQPDRFPYRLLLEGGAPRPWASAEGPDAAPWALGRVSWQ